MSESAAATGTVRVDGDARHAVPATDGVRRAPLGRADLAALAALLAFALLLALGSLARRHDLHFSGAFLFGDPAYNLLVADRLLAGDALHAEIASPYGPIPAYLHAAAAALFGNTIATLHLLFLGLSLGNLALAYLLFRRMAGPGGSLALSVLALTPNLLIPGSLVGAFESSPYIPLERTLLLLAALCWSPPMERTPRRAAGLGVIFGLWQGVRFGGGFFAGLTVLIIDGVALRRGGGSARAWLRTLLVTLAAFLLVEAVWVAWSFATMPAAIARDSLWPMHVLETYAAWVRPTERWPAWGGINMLVGQQLTLLAGGAAGVALLAAVLARGRGGRDAAALPLLIPFVFFVVASVGLFRQVYHFYQFGWAVVFPLAWVAMRGRAWAAAVALVLLPCFALNVKAQLVNAPDPSLEPMALPDGETVWLPPRMRQEVMTLVAALNPAEERGSVVLVPMAAGLQYFFDLPSPLRQPWLLPGFVRPYDEEEFVRAVRGSRAVVLAATPGITLDRDPCRWFSAAANPFKTPVCEAISPLLEAPVRVGAGFLIFPVKRGAAGDV